MPLTRGNIIRLHTPREGKCGSRQNFAKFCNGRTVVHTLVGFLGRLPPRFLGGFRGREIGKGMHAVHFLPSGSRRALHYQYHIREHFKRLATRTHKNSIQSLTPSPAGHVLGRRYGYIVLKINHLINNPYMKPSACTFYDPKLSPLHANGLRVRQY